VSARHSRSVLAGSLFAVETVGLVAVLYLWLPLYRRLQAGPAGDRPGADIVWKALLVAAVMQVCYWGRRRIPESEGEREGVVLGHVLLFLSRLAFVFVGSSFSLFILRAQDTHASPLGMIGSLFILFTIFCYVLDLEQLARPRLVRASSHREHG